MLVAVIVWFFVLYLILDSRFWDFALLRLSSDLRSASMIFGNFLLISY